jgi:glycosyltransferase involved in cell wall biosynthesis
VKELRSLALIEPLGDTGISTYAHELAEALVGAGVETDVYGPEWSWSRSLPRAHRLYPVLGSALFRQKDVLGSSGHDLADPPAPQAANAPASSGTSRGFVPAARAAARNAFLTLELAAWLRRRGYDAVWTQWPEFGARHPDFWWACRRLGLRLIHQVHNVLPHERRGGDVRLYRRVYGASDVLILYSHAAHSSLVDVFPDAGDKALVSPHGMYTIYPRKPASRAGVRSELGVSPSTALVLFFGGVRPYKNVDVVLHALRSAPDLDLVLLVAGVESGYPDAQGVDKLARTRRLAAELGVERSVKCLAGPFGFERTSELFEAADAVILPYRESFGSGQLLLAMTFGKWIVATAAGGMDEYLCAYPRGLLLRELTPEGVSRTLRELVETLGERGSSPLSWEGTEFSWPEIVAALLPKLASRLSNRR